MPSLNLTEQPGFTEIPDNTFDAGNAAAAAGMKALNAAAKFAAVRTEEFWGYYKHGETVQLPVSPADGYAYSREELLYVWSLFHSAAPPGTPLNGTQEPQMPGATSGDGTLLAFGAHVDQATGLVSVQVDYYKTQHMVTHDGILLVHTLAKRLR